MQKRRKTRSYHCLKCDRHVQEYDCRRVSDEILRCHTPGCDGTIFDFRPVYFDGCPTCEQKARNPSGRS